MVYHISIIFVMIRTGLWLDVYFAGRKIMFQLFVLYVNSCNSPAEGSILRQDV